MRTSLRHLQAALTSARMTGQLAADADVQLTGLTTDSRQLQAGDLFLALRGEQFDAHDFLDTIAVKGAVAVVAEHVPVGFDLPALLVPDSKMALAEIARDWRGQFSLPVIGVTGSNGKTTVKEMIASILVAHVGAESCLSTRGNLNNEIGVPLTLLRLQAQHRCAVIELGMNHPGEIALLASVAMPTVGLVNNAQREHQEFMQSVDAVAEENGAVIRSLPFDGVAVFPANDVYTPLWRAMAQESGQRKVLTFGLSDGSDASDADAVEAIDVHASYQVNDFGSDIQIHLAGAVFALRLSAAGEHNVLNALAAAACCHSIGVTNEVIARGLQNFQPVSGRLQHKQAVNGARIIDDSYNANPDSARAAIEVLAQFGPDTVLVLGDMGEVGDDGIAFHQEIGAYAGERCIGQLLTLGSLAQHATESFGGKARHFEHLADMLTALDSLISTASTVLVKGSRFMKMERVVAHLIQPTILGNH